MNIYLYKNILCKTVNLRLIFALCLFVTINISVNFEQAAAAASITAIPNDGGNSLRFGRVDLSGQTNKEVRIRITSSDNTQYQVYQRLLDPFVNQHNQRLTQRAMKAYTLTASNAQGTLYLQNSELLGYSDQLLYTSSPSGESDSFLVVYQPDYNEIESSGNYLGRIQFIVRPIGSGSSQHTILNAYLDAKSDFTYSFKTTSRSNNIDIKSNASDGAALVTVDFNGHLGAPLKIYQEVDIYPQSAILEPLEVGIVKYQTSGNVSGDLYHSSASILERGRELLFMSKGSQDSFSINYWLDEMLSQDHKAGQYVGKIRYIIEHDQTQEVHEVTVNISIDPIFNLEVTLPPEGLKFKSVLVDSPPDVKEVNVVVKSNMGKPYMVMQKTVTPLTNSKGKTIESEYFSIMQELGTNASGKIQQPQFSPIPVDESAIFISDNKGSSAEFKVYYRLKGYTGMEPGDYSTMIVYSLGEI